jgi:outer membrane receptor protein involved in Fe transport
VQNENTFKRVVTGLDGKLGGSWKWSAYYQYGQNLYETSYGNQIITSRNGVTALGNVNLAVDAVVAPAGNAAGVAAGTIVCRSTLTNPANGCKPLNIFGVGNASSDAVNYVTGTAHLTALYKQHVAEASIQGDVFNTWAGPVSVAAGASYRYEAINATSDSLSQELAFGVVNPLPSSGHYSVKEVFGEAAIPLAKDTRFAKALDLDIAGRVTNYSTSGTVVTWKAGSTYTPFEGLRFRATRSRDIRAPSLDELYRGGSQARVSVTDTPSGSSSQVNALQITGGNSALIPETADTLSYGIVIQPKFMPGFSFSVDRYDIEIKNVISTISAQEILDRCSLGNTAICGLVSRQNGEIQTITANFLNLALLSTDGLDIEASYRRNITDWVGGSTDTSIGARILANYVHSFKTSDGRTTIEQAGSIADTQPHWTVFASYFVKRGGGQFTVTHNFVGAGAVRELYNVDPQQKIDDNHVASRFYTNVNFTYDIKGWGGTKQVFFNVDNVFNVKPPKGFGFGYGLNAAPLYDVIGPMFKFGVKARF